MIKFAKLGIKRPLPQVARGFLESEYLAASLAAQATGEEMEIVDDSESVATYHNTVAADGKEGTDFTLRYVTKMQESQPPTTSISHSQFDMEEQDESDILEHLEYKHQADGFYEAKTPSESMVLELN